jgi:hypothetical protein
VKTRQGWTWRLMADRYAKVPTGSLPPLNRVVSAGNNVIELASRFFTVLMCKRPKPKG